MNNIALILFIVKAAVHNDVTQKETQRKETKWWMGGQEGLRAVYELYAS